MTAHSYDRGHPTHYDGIAWRFDDTGETADGSRVCVRCGRQPTLEGHDACLGSLPGVISACCGHGVEPPYHYPPSLAE